MTPVQLSERLYWTKKYVSHYEGKVPRTQKVEELRLVTNNHHFNNQIYGNLGSALQRSCWTYT